MNTKPYKKLAWLNELSAAKAEAAFLDCCGSREWAMAMTRSRPYPMLENLFVTAEKIWFSLPIADHLEAFAAHPKIGSEKSSSAKSDRSANWSESEQSGMNEADRQVRSSFVEANRLYEDKFGFIFIVCATGKTAEEMLAVCRARLSNSVQTELEIAAEEQQKITEIRLCKLLEK
ncbi:MAG: 2-oxo-4-hydroxy-4-carboxy-5-ureidoimidazoline decarboxylase [Pyrinomonadaceae bacterium]